MTTFPDLSAYEQDTTEADGLTLPVNGKNYIFTSSLSFARARQVQRIRAEAARLADARQENPDAQPSDEFVALMQGYDEIDLYLELIGPDMQTRLEADGVLYETVVHIGATLLAWHLNGPAVARRVWTRGHEEAADNRPPAKASGTSKARTTSRSGSTTKTPRKPASPRKRGATTSTAGR